MLTKERMERLKRAGEYQKKAILELLPEGMEQHMDVICQEVRLMAKETMACFARECMQQMVTPAGGRNGQNEKAGEKVRKVSID